MKNLVLLFLAFIVTGPVLLLGQIPSISSFVPLSGQPGTVVTLSGSNFSSVTTDNIVYFGAVRAEVIAASASELLVAVPLGATFKPITVTVNGMIGSSQTPFRATFLGSSGSFVVSSYIYGGSVLRWGTVGDIDGDGKTDFLAIDELGAFLTVYKNTSTIGNLSWDSFLTATSFGTQPEPYAIEVDDFNADGKLDVVVTYRNSNTISIFENTSTPGFISLAPSIEFETTLQPLFVSAADLDNDGKTDIATANANGFGQGTISVLRNTSTSGSIAFAPHIDFAVGDGGIWCVKLEDVDNDKKVDMLVTSGGSALFSIFKNISTPGSLHGGSFAPRVDFATGAYPAIMATGDFDGDNKIDVAVGNAVENSISMFRNVTTAGLIDASSFVREDIPSPGPWNPTAGDVDGDGKLEILVRDGSNGDLLIYKNSSTIGSFSFSPYTIPMGANPLGISVADLDDDTKADLMVTGENFNLIIVLKNFTVTPPQTLPAEWVSNSGFEARWSGPENAYEYLLDVSAFEDFSTTVPGFQDKLVYGYPWEVMHTAVAGLSADKTYYYRLRTILNGVVSDYSETMAVHTAPDPLTGSPNIWAKKFGNSGDEEIQSMVSDNLGNIYIAGHFNGALTLGKTKLNSGGDWDIFFARLDPMGNVIWARSIGGPYYDNEVSLAITSSGLFLTAQSSGEIDVDPGPASMIFMNEGSYENDGFFARYNHQNGALIWAQKLPDATTLSSSSIDADDTGVYISGFFTGAVDFNPGNGTAMLQSQGGRDIFIAKYTLQGKYNWAYAMGGYSDDLSTGLLLDESGVYIHGRYGEGADLDPKSGIFKLEGYGGFFGRYDKGNGKFRYAKNVGNQTVTTLSRFLNKLFIGGDFYGSIDADPGPHTNYIGSDGFNHGLVGCYDLLDGKFRWAKAMQATAFVGPRKILADITGVYISGYFAGNANFDHGNDQANRSGGEIDAFVAQYSRNEGRLLWAKGIGSPGRAVSIAATLSPLGHYLGGLFGRTVNFDPYAGQKLLTSVDGTADLFVAKYDRWCIDLLRPIITSAQSRSGEIVLTSNEETGNQWFKDGESIAGAIGSSLSIRSAGIYTVKCTQAGCNALTSDAFKLSAKEVVKESDQPVLSIQNKIYPNPAVESITLDLPEFDDGHIAITVTDGFGKVLISTTTSGGGTQRIDVSNLASGVYVVQARQRDKVFAERIIKR